MSIRDRLNRIEQAAGSLNHYSDLIKRFIVEFERALNEQKIPFCGQWRLSDGSILEFNHFYKQERKFFRREPTDVTLFCNMSREHKLEVYGLITPILTTLVTLYPEFIPSSEMRATLEELLAFEQTRSSHASS